MLEDRGGQFDVRLHLHRADGKAVLYRLTIDAALAHVGARETLPERLPDWCPELHINDGGYFCLGWGADAPPPVTDEATAEKWWQIVLSFLRLQERAAALKRWPNNNVWAHGSAVRFQQYAEAFAAGLDKNIAMSLRSGRLTAQKRRKGIVRVLRDGNRLYSVRPGKSVQEARVVNLRRACVCGSGKAMRRCGEHMAMAAGLALALHAQDLEADDFWSAFRDRACCGRIVGCPLQKKDIPS